MHSIVKKIFLKDSVVKLANLLEQRKIKNIIFLNYAPELEKFLLWCQQLIAESLGKKEKGFLPMISSVPKDHHSLLQLYLDGPKDKLFHIFSINSKTNEIWVNEHGPKGGDEINVLKPGKNYGWPIVTYGEEYWGGKIGQGITSLEGFEDPIWYWVPSIAPSGMIFYDKNMFPEFKGHLLVSSLKFKSLYLVKIENGLPQKELVLFKKRFGRVRDIEQLNDGSILIISDEKKGGLYKIYR